MIYRLALIAVEGLVPGCTAVSMAETMPCKQTQQSSNMLSLFHLALRLH